MIILNKKISENNCFNYLGERIVKNVGFTYDINKDYKRRYKRNAITCELQRALMISDNFDDLVKLIRDLYIRTGFPYAFKFSCFDHIIPEIFIRLTS